ncbi:MAG TPA: hypothetical protein VGO80_19780 [Solirubrobacteraceae bacterium]|jgi:hypothetical protein|nr:hypothetical protein [Solirubrobacteraceae bacterium]
MTAGLAQLGHAWGAWRQIAIHDVEAAERNAQLVVWVDDRTRQLVTELEAVRSNSAGGALPPDSIRYNTLLRAKELALHEYRDEEWRCRLDLLTLRGRETGWYAVWRWLRRRPAPHLTARAEAEPFLERWREPVIRHNAEGGGKAKIRDRTLRTTEDALAELSGLRLT